MLHIRLFTCLILMVGCADITPIEHQRQYGPVTTLQDWFTSSYLLSYSDGHVLFDAGFRPDTLEASLADEGVALSDVTHIFLTHGHGDHLGGLTLFPDAQILAMEAEVDLIEEETEGAFSVERCLTNGELFSFDEVEVEVIAAPGHTAGNTMYRVDNVLLMGDTALVTADGAIEPVAEKRSEKPEEAAATLRAMADRLDPQQIEWLVPAHSSGIQGMDALIAFANSAD